jgi:hypothetical protein
MRHSTVPTAQQEGQCIPATCLIAIIPGALTGRQTLSSSVVKHTEWINTQARTGWEILFLRSDEHQAAGSNQEQLVLALDRCFTTRCDVIRGRSLSRITKAVCYSHQVSSDDCRMTCFSEKATSWEAGSTTHRYKSDWMRHCGGTLLTRDTEVCLLGTSNKNCIMHCWLPDLLPT